MTQTVRVPDPVYDKINTEAERRDVSLGTVVEDWMEKAENWEQLGVEEYK